MSAIIYFSIPVFVIMLLLEIGWSHLGKHGWYETRDTAANLSMGVGNVIISAIAKTVLFLPFIWLYEHRLFDIPQNAVWAWVALLFAEDFCYYWFHRVHHEVRFFWAAHVNHHSSQRFNLAVALRQSWMTPITGFVFWLPLAWIGFHPLMILTQQAISLLYQFWIHSQGIKRLGILESVMNTPSHHRVHHGTNPQYLDKNYAGIFIIWDKLFGTFEPEREKVNYGLVQNIDTYNPFKIAFHEFAAMVKEIGEAKSLAEILDALFSSPSKRAARKEAEQLKTQ